MIPPARYKIKFQDYVEVNLCSEECGHKTNKGQHPCFSNLVTKLSP